MLMEFAAILAVTGMAVIGMLNLKDFVNRSEAMLAMKHLADRIQQYRQQYGSIPPESWVNLQRENLPGNVRLGGLQYRGLWIDFESSPDTILAYSRKNYKSPLVGKGYVVLRLNGRVQWLGKEEFETLLAQQQSQDELEMLRRHREEGLGLSPPL